MLVLRLFIIGGAANEIVTLIIQPKTTRFLYVQTEDAAKAHFS